MAVVLQAWPHTKAFVCASSSCTSDVSVRQLGADVSTDRASPLMAHTINSTPFSLVSVTVFTQVWRLWLGMDWAGQKKYQQTFARNVACFEHCSLSAGWSLHPLHITRKSISSCITVFPSPSTDRRGIYLYLAGTHGDTPLWPSIIQQLIRQGKVPSSVASFPFLSTFSLLMLGAVGE